MEFDTYLGGRIYQEQMWKEGNDHISGGRRNGDKIIRNMITDSLLLKNKVLNAFCRFIHR